eukprot:evm.model.scf_1246.8 EVM.evm.TU.scf_1246.8   scf_1246:40849-46477(-)
MASQQLALSRMANCSPLSARSSIAGASALRVKAGLRKSCARRRHVTCAKPAPESQGAKGGTFRLWGVGKKAAVAKGKAPPPGRNALQIRRRTGTAKVQRPMGAKARRPAARDRRTVFVAGATGRLGSRVVKCLLEAGFNVVAGVRNVDAAKESSALCGESAYLTPAQSRRVKMVEFDLENEDEDEFAAAIGKAGKVVFAAGTNEFNSPATARNVDGVGTSRLVKVAAELGVQQFVLITSLGTGKFGWPAAVLNLFWGVLFWKRTAEKTLEASGMPYTIVRPGGMERPTDTYKETHNLTLSTRDQRFGGQVSRLQVAELVAACCQNPAASEYKTMELVAETDAPKISCMELIAAHPAEKSREEMARAQQTADSVKREIAAAERRLEQLKKNSEDLSERAAALRARAREFQTAEKRIGSVTVGAQRAGDKVQRDLDLLKLKAADLAKQEAAAKAVLSALQTAGRAGKLLSKQEQDAVALPILQPELVQNKIEEQKQRAEQEKQKALAARKASPKSTPAEAPKAAPKVVSKPGFSLFPRKQVQPPKAVAPKTAASPQIEVEDLEAKAAEARAQGDINKEAKLKSQAASEARRQAAERAIAERAAKLEADQRARERAAEEARKAILLDARLKAQAAANAKKERAASKKVEDVAKQKAKAEAQREAQRIAKEKEQQEAQAKAEEAAKMQAEAKAKVRAEAKAKEEAQKKAAEARTKVAQEAKHKAAVTATAKSPAAAGFKWPWESATVPEPEELVQRREEAQQWIDNWKAGGGTGEPVAQKRTTEASATVAEVAKTKVAVTKKLAAAKAEAVAEKEKAAEAVRAELEAKRKAAAAAKAKRLAPTGFRWPWEPATAPEPEELVQRREEAQQWIDNWKAGCENGVPPGKAPVDSVKDAKEWIDNWRANNTAKK